MRKERKLTILRGIPRQDRNRVSKMLRLFDPYNGDTSDVENKSKEYIHNAVKAKVEDNIGYTGLDAVRTTGIKTLRNLMDTRPGIAQTKMSDKQALTYFVNGGLKRMLILTITEVLAGEMDDMTRRQLVALSKVNWVTIYNPSKHED